MKRFILQYWNSSKQVYLVYGIACMLLWTASPATVQFCQHLELQLLVWMKVNLNKHGETSSLVTSSMRHRGHSRERMSPAISGTVHWLINWMWHNQMSKCVHALIKWLRHNRMSNFMHWLINWIGHNRMSKCVHGLINWMRHNPMSKCVHWLINRWDNRMSKYVRWLTEWANAGKD
jgi:hypothetical protein